MKKFIKKNLAVILSFAIILTTLLPVLTGLGGVSALSAEEQVVVDNLKTAWGQMTLNPTSILYPNYTFPNGSKTHMGDNIKATTGELPFNATKEMLGDYYAVEHNYNVTYKVADFDSTQRILFYGNVDNADNAKKNVTNYSGFYFNIYFEELTSDITLMAKVVAGGDNTALAKRFVITADKKGSWVTIKDTDLIKGGLAALNGMNELNCLQLNFSATNGATVEAVVGSVQFVENVTPPADSETADWTLVDWVKAALKVDLAEYSNTDAFIAALAAAKNTFGEKYAIANLIKEWEALSVYHNPDINPNRWWKPTPNGAEPTGMSASSSYTETLPANVDLGANFATFTGLGNEAGISSKQCILYEFCKDGSSSEYITSGAKSSVPVNTIDDIYFWFKADNMTSGITFNIEVMTLDGTSKTNTLPTYVIPASKSGQWVKVSLKEIGGSEWYGTLTDKLYRFMVAMSNANGATVTVGSGRIIVPGACALPANVAETADAWLAAAKKVDLSAYIDTTAFTNAVNALKVYKTVLNAEVEALKLEWENLEYIGAFEDTSLEDSESWTDEQWVDKARALDLSNYKNTAAFEAALYAAIESVYGFTKADIAAQELIAAWGELIAKPKSVLYPNYTFPNGSKTHMGDNIKATTGELPFNATKEMLGDYYAVEHNYNVTYKVADFDSTQRILFYGNVDNADNAKKNVTNYSGFYFNIYFEELTSDITLMAKVVAGGDNTALAKRFVITADKKGSWVTIKDTDLIKGGLAALNGMNELNCLQLNFSATNGATVEAVVGSLQFIEKVGALDGAETMAPEDLLLAAMKLDLSEYSNTEKFIEKMDALKLCCEEGMAIYSIKNAINGLSSYTNYHIYPRRYWDAVGVLCKEDTYVTKVSEYTGSLPEGADSSNVGTYLGEKMATISGLTDMAAAYKTSGNKQTVLYECNDMVTTPFTSHQIDDMYFWYKLEGAASAKIINGIYVDAPDGRVALKINGEITLIGDGKWHRVSFNEVYGEDWISANDIPDGKVYRILMSIGEAEGGTITLGSIETITYAGLLPSDTDAWTIADWIAFASRLNATNYNGADEFEEALSYAKDVRDRLMIARSSNLIEYDDINSANIDGATIVGNNILETLLPTVYHSADGESKNTVEGTSLELFTDNDSSTIGAVSGLDNSNEKSFTQFVYKFAGEVNISDFIIYNDAANIADKYYIYTANTESELFLQENLLVAYNNTEGKVAQRFNFDGKPDAAGAYLGIRVFGDSDTVSFAEFKAFGEVITYEVETGNFSNTKIANIGKNLLDGVNPKIKTLLKFDWNGFMGKGSAYQPFNLTDNDINTPVGFNNPTVRIHEKDDTISMHIYYDLGTTYSIEKLLWNNHKDKGLETGKYEIYASKDVNSLFLSRSKVLSYDNMVDGPNGTTVSQLFTLKNEVIARYVSFHITYPISDWDYRITTTENNLSYPRLSELGVYGTEWDKPDALVNLTSHVPMDVYRTDLNGKRTEVGEDEYNGSEHKLTYDGKEETSADVKIKNGEKLDFVYNLAAEMTLEEIKFKVANSTVKKMNIYASTVEDKIWQQESLIYSDVNGLGKTEFGKSFAEAPLKARYIRFEIIENDGEDLVISEIEAIGGNDQEFNYMNLVEEKPESASFYLQEVGKGGYTVSTQYGKKWKWSWNRLDDLWPINKAFDNDNDSVYDLYGGKNGEESVNILLDLGTLNSIDGITLVGGSESVYWPDEMNYYFGDDEVALFQKDAKPAQKWMQSTADGVFTYEFVPQVAQYVRIELVRSEVPVYSQHSDAIAAIISEIQVDGLELKSRAVNGIAATVEDEKTGIKAEILALRENDVYDAIQSMTVIKRAPTDEELASAKEQGLKVDTDIYEIYFVDVNGDIVTDTGGREIVLYIPEKLSSITEDIFVLLGEFGSLSMIEFDSADGYYYFTIDDISSALNVALGYMVEDEEEFEDTDDSDDEDFEDEDEFEEDDEEDEEETKRKKIKVIRKNKGENSYLWLILAIGAGVVVIAAGVVLFIVLKKKKDKESEE